MFRRDFERERIMKLGTVYFTDGHTEDILYYHCTDCTVFITENNIYKYKYEPFEVYDGCKNTVVILRKNRFYEYNDDKEFSFSYLSSHIVWTLVFTIDHFEIYIEGETNNERNFIKNVWF